jgi:hypothetical protein
MARHTFGGDLAAWAFTAGGGNVATLVGGATVTFWSAAAGGTQYTDLLLGDGTTAANYVASQDGTGGTVVGAIPTFYGPDGVVAMWASANGGPRALMVATDTAASAAANATAVAGVQASLTTHIGAANPHATKVRDLADANAATPTDGQVFAYDAASGKWLPKTIAGVSGTAMLNTAQTFTKTQTIGPLSDVNSGRLLIYAEATGQVADLMTFFSGTDTGAGGARQRTTYFNEKGELRVIAAALNSVGVRIKGQTGQTAHITEWTDIGNNPISWVEPDGRGRFPNLGHVFAFSIAGAVTTGTGAHRIYNDTGVQLTIRAVRATVGTPPAGASIIVHVNKNGSTIFTTTANRPTIAAAANTSGKVTNADVTTLNDGDYLTVTVDQIGSTTAGSDLVVQVLAY